MRKRLHALSVSVALAVATAGVTAQISSAAGGRPQGPPAPALVPIPPDVAKMPFMNPALPVDQRVEDLLHRMTLEEKASQLVNQSRAIPRLGISAYDWWSEALHGVAQGTATVFPQPIGLAATFDAPAVKEMGIAIGTEGRAKYNMATRAGHHRIFEGIDFWSPNINIFRDPRWGRGQETYGEDPFLTGRMGVAFVTGMQGDDPKYYRVIATPKHYAVHSGPEPSRHEIDVKVSKHDEEDTYLPAFRDAVVEGKAASVMCVYNSVNGQPGCANDFLLKDTLRSKWGFRGYVVSDCDAVADIERGHHYVKTLAEAAAVSLKAGTDNDCADFFALRANDDHGDYQRYIDAVKQGLMTEADVDVTMRRLLWAKFHLGMFDPDSMVKYAQTPDAENDSAAHRELAHRLANETMVLLKNDGILPLKASGKKILVLGPLADSSRVQEGNYHGTASHYVTALDGIRKQFPDAEISFEPGTSFLRNPLPIPASMLSHGNGEPGLKGEYFSSAELSGTPLATRNDLEVNFDRHSPKGFPEGITKSYVRWTGFFTPAESGMYSIGTYGLSNRLYLDNKLVIDDMTAHPPGNKLTEMQLEAGRKYAVKLENVAGGTPAVRLIFAKAGNDATVRATAAIKQADLVIGVVGINSDLEGEEMKVDVPGFKGGDRTSLDLPKQEEELLEAAKAAGKPLVVVLMNGSALSVNWAAANANAILEAWYSGEEGGTAIAETLAGVNNPSGKLPITFYKGVADLPDFNDYSMQNRTYRYFQGTPLYPFGYGLSYTSFAYSNLKAGRGKVKAGDPLEVSVDVTNKGDRDGDDVVEVYVMPPSAPGNPQRALRGFTRVRVAKGATSHVKVLLKPRDLSFVNEQGDRMIAAGSYRLSAGGGQPNTSASVAEGSFTIEGSQKLPE